MGYSKKLTKQQRQQIKNARRQNRALNSVETQKKLHQVQRSGK